MASYANGETKGCACILSVTPMPTGADLERLRGEIGNPAEWTRTGEEARVAGTEAFAAVTGCGKPDSKVAARAYAAIDKYSELTQGSSGAPAIPKLVGGALGNAFVDANTEDADEKVGTVVREGVVSLIEGLPPSPTSAMFEAGSIAVASMGLAALSKSDTSAEAQMETVKAALTGVTDLAEAARPGPEALETVTHQVGTAIGAGLLGGKDPWAMKVDHERVQDAGKVLCNLTEQTSDPVSIATLHSAFAAVAAASDGSVESVGSVLQQTEKIAERTAAGPDSGLVWEVGHALGTVLVGGWGVAQRRDGDAADVDMAADMLVEALEDGGKKIGEPETPVDPIVAAASQIAFSRVALASDGSSASVSAALRGADRLVSASGNRTMSRNVGAALGSAVLHAHDTGNPTVSKEAVQLAASTLAEGAYGADTSSDVVVSVTGDAIAKVAAAADVDPASVLQAGAEDSSATPGHDPFLTSHDTRMHETMATLLDGFRRDGSERAAKLRSPDLNPHAFGGRWISQQTVLCLSRDLLRCRRAYDQTSTEGASPPADGSDVSAVVGQLRSLIASAVSVQGMRGEDDICALASELGTLLNEWVDMELRLAASATRRTSAPAAPSLPSCASFPSLPDSPQLCLPPPSLRTVRQVAAWLDEGCEDPAPSADFSSRENQSLCEAARNASSIYLDIAREFKEPFCLRSVFLETGDRQKLSFFVDGRWGLSKKRFFTTRCADGHVGGWSRTKRMQILVFDAKDRKRLGRQHREGVEGAVLDSDTESNAATNLTPRGSGRRSRARRRCSPPPGQGRAKGRATD